MDIYERRRMVIDFITSKIEDGEYKKDERLPSDREVSEKFDISRLDARKAFSSLESMGYIYSLQGRGRFVKKNIQRIELKFLDNRGFSRKLEGCGEIKTENLRIKKIKFDEKIYNKLNLNEDEKVYKLLRVRYLNNVPIAYHISYLNGEIFKNIKREVRCIKEITDYYKLYNIERTENREVKLKVQYAKKEIREILKCTELIPIIKSEHIVCDKDKRIEFTEIFYRGDIFEFSMY